MTRCDLHRFVIVAMATQYSQWQASLIVVTCGIIVAGTILGNALVCTAVAIVRKLRTPSNLLIVSLAVSDLLVAALVMPFATTYEVMGRWVLGQAVCDMWTSLDVMLCTASILNLCMISIDRYFVITRPFQYAMKRSPTRMTLMIVLAWILSALISIPPLFGWKADSADAKCVLSQAIGYQFYATIGAFYLPLAVMIVIYYRIYMVSSRIAEAEARSKPNGDAVAVQLRLQTVAAAAAAEARAPVSHPQADSDGRLLQRLAVQNGCGERKRSGQGGGGDGGEVTAKKPSKKKKEKKRKGLKSTSNAISKDCKATKTLGIIMGAFTACWLPFFILALIKPFCPQPDGSCIPHWLNSLFLWLGYANSFLNPIIYARFNRDFRKPFREILLLRCWGINVRLRSDTYAEQFGRPDAQRQSAARLQPSGTVVHYQSVRGRTFVKLDDCSAKNEEVRRSPFGNTETKPVADL